MTKLNCPICCGSGTIKLPVYRRPSATVDFSEDMSCRPDNVRESSRTYPCPECSETVNEENVAILHAKLNVDKRVLENGEYMSAVRNDLASHLVRDLSDRGFISFKGGQIDHCLRTIPVRATVGVVSTKTVASMESRIAERQFEKASALVQMASAEISLWGSRYTGNTGSISKQQAIDSLKLSFSRLSEPSEP